MNSTGTPGGPGIPAGWYDDPSGHGLRWWDGGQWTEHVHSVDSAASVESQAGRSGEREGAPPRDLVKLRESIRGRGTRSVGIVLGAVVLVLVVIGLLISGGSDGGGGSETPVPGATGPGISRTPAQAARQAAVIRRNLRRELKSGDKSGVAAAKRALRAERKALREAGVANPAARIEAAEKALEAGE